MAEQDDGEDQGEAAVLSRLTAAKCRHEPALEGGTAGAAGASVEQVPQLHEDEGREEDALGVALLDAAIVEVGIEVEQEGSQGDDENGADGEDLDRDRVGQDESGGVSRGAVHVDGLGRLGGQGEGGEGIHDEIDPEHLGNGEGERDAEEGAEEGHTQSGEVDGELEEQEALDIGIEGAAPADRADDAGKGVVEQDDVAGFFGDLVAGAHGEADMSGVQGRSIVDAIAGDGNDFTLRAKQVDEAGFIVRAGAGEDAQAIQLGDDFRVIHCGEGGAIEVQGRRAIRVFTRPEATLASDFLSGEGRIAGDDFDLNAGLLAFGDGGLDVVAQGVVDGDEAEPMETAGDFTLAQIFPGGVILRAAFIGAPDEGQGTHAATLVIGERAGEGGALGFGEILAGGQGELGGAFAVDARIIEAGGHELALGGEGNLAEDWHGGALRGVILFLRFIEPTEQRAFSAIADDGDGAGFILAQVGGGIGRDGLDDERGVGSGEIDFMDGHGVLREGTGFVGADDGGGADRFRGIHAPHEALVSHEAAHRMGQAEGDAHGESLGYSDDDDGHRDHEIMQQFDAGFGRQPLGRIRGEGTAEAGEEEQSGGEGQGGADGDGPAGLGEVFCADGQHGPPDGGEGDEGGRAERGEGPPLSAGQREGAADGALKDEGAIDEGSDGQTDDSDEAAEAFELGGEGRIFVFGLRRAALQDTGDIAAIAYGIEAQGGAAVND